MTAVIRVQADKHCRRAAPRVDVHADRVGRPRRVRHERERLGLARIGAVGQRLNRLVASRTGDSALETPAQNAARTMLRKSALADNMDARRMFGLSWMTSSLAKD